MPTLALSMIVRNTERTLSACLGSVRGIVQEIVIADTGSTDGTVQLARQCGARVFSMPWENDFARARNRALAEVRSDWVLMLDADEVLDPAAAQSLPPLLIQSEMAGYLVTIWNYVLSLSERLWDQAAKPNTSTLEAARKYPAYTEHENVRLFRHLPEIYFVGRVHESVGPRIVESGMKLSRAGFVIHHFGLVAEAETRAFKNQLYRELGREKIREMPDDAQAHFELGLVEFDNFRNDAEALKCLERACQLNPRLAVAWLFAGLAHIRLGQYTEALKSLKKAEGTNVNRALKTEAEGDVHYNLNDFELAHRCYRQAAKLSAGVASIESKLGLTEVRLGRTEQGLARMRRALEGNPTTGELYDRLLTAQVWLGRLEEAAEIAERKINAVEPQPAFYLRAASIRAQQGDLRRAAGLLHEGSRQFPTAEKLRQALTELELRAGSTKVL